MKDEVIVSLFNRITFAPVEDQNRLMELAIGRLFRIMSRPFQEGDHEQFDMCRSVIMTIAEARKSKALVDHSPNYARDHLAGAAGDA